MYTTCLRSIFKPQKGNKQKKIKNVKKKLLKSFLTMDIVRNSKFSDMKFSKKVLIFELKKYGVFVQIYKYL